MPQQAPRAAVPPLPRAAVPPLMDEFIPPPKATSHAAVIPSREPMTVASCAISAGFRSLEWYAAALIYHLGTVCVWTVLQRGLEARLGAAHRR